MTYRKKYTELPGTRPVLDAMGRCRRILQAAQDSVVRFGATFNVLAIVVVAIDTCALFLTGSDMFYAESKTVLTTSNHSKWGDSGSPE